MRKIINIAELISTGRINQYGRFFRPYVQINTPEDNTLSITLEEINSEVIIAIPCKYREATTFIDIPIFKAAVYDENENLIDEFQTAVVPRDYLSMIDLMEQTDTYARWNFSDSEIRFRLNPREIPLGTDAEPRKLVFHLTVKLRRWKRPSLGYHFGAPLEDFPTNIEDPIDFGAWAPTEVRSRYTEEWITFYIKANSFNPGVYIDSSFPADGIMYGDHRFYTHDANYVFNWSLADVPGWLPPLRMVHARDTEETTFGEQPIKYYGRKYTLKVPWKSHYHIDFLIRNCTDRNITGWKIKINECKGLNLGEMRQYLEGTISTPPSPSESIFHEFEAGVPYPIILNPDEVTIFSTHPSFMKNWEWFRIKPPEWFHHLIIDYGEFGMGDWVRPSDFYDIIAREKTFTYLSTEILFRTEDGDILIEHPGRISFGHVKVSVAKNKVNALKKWGEEIEGKLTVDAGFFWIGILSAGLAWWAGLILGALSVIVFLIPGANEYLLVEAADPIELDNQYSIKQDFTELISTPDHIQNIPAFMSRFIKINTEALALYKTLLITLNRFVSAIYHNDISSIELQKNHSKLIFEHIEERIYAVQEEVHYIQHMIAFYINEMDEDQLREAFSNLLEVGLPEPFVQEKLEAGYPQELLDAVEASLQNYTFDQILGDDLKKAFENFPIKCFHSLLEEFLKSVKVMKHINKIELSSKYDHSNFLLNEGILSYEEFLNRIKNIEIDQCYLLEEVKFIEIEKRILLKNLGILSTFHFLKRSSSNYRRTKLANKLGIDKGQILKWANISDLLRVPGIEEYHANVLEQIGVDTVIELSTRNPDLLYQSIVEYSESSNVKGTLSKMMVHEWVAKAKTMKRKLKY